MLDRKILPAMVEISNNSKLTQIVADIIKAKFDEKEKRDFLEWIEKIVKIKLK